MKRAKTQVIRKLSHLPRGKRVVELVIDDTDVEKFGESVFGVGWYKHTEEEPWRAIQLVVLGVLIGDWLVPLDFRIYVPMKVCKYIPMQFETKLEMAAEMLKKLKLPQGLNVGVMFDSWYLCPTVTQAVVEKNYSWYSRCRSNRNIQWEGDEEKEKKKRTKKKTIRLDKYAPTIKWQPLDYRTNRKNPAVVGHQRIGNLGDVGRVKMVITSLRAEGDDKIAYFCSNHTHIPMVELVKKFERRWKIEVYFKESRRHLALEHWYFRDMASVVHHLCLSLVAMITCFCIRWEQRKNHDDLGTLGEFIQEVQNKNQRNLLCWFLEQWHLEPLTDEDLCRFNGLCEDIGL
jgi:hypothetical protein